MPKRVQAQFSRRSGSPAARQIRTSGDRYRPQIETEQKSDGVILKGMMGLDVIRRANRAFPRARGWLGIGPAFPVHPIHPRKGR